uniref:Ubiquitin-like protease family profile domain-containing protein n=1 Tax=viral metagenome TaxID=1070528 RepID=A0A6C0L8G9_9ZZZZ
MNKEIIKYNSPKNAKNPYIFSKESLIHLIDAWNKYKPDKIIYKKTDAIAKLSLMLNEKIKPVCDDKQYWCWPGTISKIASSANDTKTKEIIKMIETEELRPEMPIEWYANSREWLSNYDIEDVMKQYDKDRTYKYAFLGVYPIDFSEEDKFGRCLYSKICSLDVKKYINKKIKYLGLITNLDKHNQSGSHWTSTFIIIDPRNKCYGAHYYDSNAIAIPAYIKKFINNIKERLLVIYPNNKFKITYNTIRHQKKNTECGMFSMTHQIRWMNSLLKYKELKLPDPYKDDNFLKCITNNKNITDDIMNENRKYLYRPNLKVHLSKKKIIT